MNITIFIILTIIPLIVTILYYYGITRYLKLHCENPDKYIKNYKNISPMPDIKNKIVISLTTTPRRIKYISPMINSILDQTVKVTQIVLNIPEICKNEKYIVPEKYKSIMNIITSGKDYGPATKFIPTILREDDADTIIILLDDDTIYGKDFIENLLEESKKNINKAIISKKAILFRPLNINSDIISKNYGVFTDEWIKDNISDKHTMSYYENYKSFTIK